ncbi:hypothetical protein CQZ99_10480 [Pseudomonas poae]|uniref:Uncharacterized protein n=1 Tax=Pseudomonas poae TaxID=200451 RepID=A0A2S9EUU8_9PSED|nr:hypothetical protein CQZ97_00125 [Pseudomonas poae]PRC19755.1 hypothetical protein CQZ99_10480 [Pseudomonas poae]
MLIPRHKKGSKISAHNDRTEIQSLQKPVYTERRIQAPLMVIARKLLSKTPIDYTENALNRRNVNQYILLHDK